MTETVSNIGDKLSETLGQVGTLYRTAGKKVEDARRGTANVLSGSASSVRDTGEAVDELAANTAAKLESTAAYVRNFNPGVAFGNIVQRHPATFITGAIAAGFIFGFAFRKRWMACQPAGPA